MIVQYFSYFSVDGEWYEDLKSQNTSLIQLEKIRGVFLKRII